jgi:hypothetical protein
MGALTATTTGGEPLPALIYVGSVVLATSGASSAVAVGNAGLTAITVSVLVDTWMRIGTSASVVADGLNGCRLLPAGAMWTEGVRPGAWVALATVAGGASTACISLADG